MLGKLKEEATEKLVGVAKLDKPAPVLEGIEVIDEFAGMLEETLGELEAWPAEPLLELEEDVAWLPEEVTDAVTVLLSSPT